MQQITCLNCPLRCSIDVEYDESSIYIIEGNNCERGYRFAIDKLDLPNRNAFAYVKVANSSAKTVKVITTKPISRDLIPMLEEELAKITLNAPVKVQDLVIANVFNTGVDIVAASQALEK